ncbi:MAG: hypothetical protein EXX96DRAFT_376368 [Benjaminiella poitrasii]|nr:MAG: hypothetical protein EXX96DRAFT_376287 [Benjaminiella poitrasii]KAI9471057.1 MAG: hypothetical protein EXX96DRAFT_376368 [Benjaminiella poitrasii]
MDLVGISLNDAIKISNDEHNCTCNRLWKQKAVFTYASCQWIIIFLLTLGFTEPDFNNRKFFLNSTKPLCLYADTHVHIFFNMNLIIVRFVSTIIKGILC